jgi:hypothetical protein
LAMPQGAGGRSRKRHCVLVGQPRSLVGFAAQVGAGPAFGRAGVGSQMSHRSLFFRPLHSRFAQSPLPNPQKAGIIGTEGRLNPVPLYARSNELCRELP